ncbi:MAG TPA: MFS transporter [Rhodopila sp.]|uniref:MFS transporter n=1 Tax=Rhodopila sp. TaxID=2480087 RepID=UPI002C609820|nr:MFS transporter [Rhodopila sp.]HVY16083.1 MFS transporter [Rhodopila sp.]
MTQGAISVQARPAAAWRSLLIVGLGTSVVPLDSAVNIDFPAIVARFALPIPMIQWIVIAYVLTQTSLMLTFGRIGDILGYRRVFLFGTGFSALAFLACALSPTYAMLVAARVAQGIGAGLILSCGPALATSLYPEAMRAQVLGRYMAMFGIGYALGPSAFGILVSQLGWSAVFSVRAPIAAAAFLLAWTLPKAPRAATTEPFDAAGGTLLAAALSFLLLTLNRLREPGPALAVFAVAAVACFVLFYRQERRFSRPIIDFDYFRDWGFIVTNIANALVNLAAFAIMLLAPFHLARIPDLSLPEAGFVLASSPFAMIFAAPLAGRLARRGATGIAPRVIAIVGTALSSAGLFGIAWASGGAGGGSGAGLGTGPGLSPGSSPGSGLVWLVVAMLAQGFGVGLFQVAYFDIITATIPARSRGVAGALGMATRSIGTVTGATVLMLIFQTLRASGGEGGFTPAFQATFAVAGAIAAGMAVIQVLVRGRG